MHSSDAHFPYISMFCISNGLNKIDACKWSKKIIWNCRSTAYTRVPQISFSKEDEKKEEIMNSYRSLKRYILSFIALHMWMMNIHTIHKRKQQRGQGDIMKRISTWFFSFFFFYCHYIKEMLFHSEITALDGHRTTRIKKVIWWQHYAFLRLHQYG